MYSLLDVAVEALHHQDLPENISVVFAPALSGPAWSINAGVCIDRDADGAPLKFRFSTPELFPAIVYLFVAQVTEGLLEEGGASYFIQNPNELRITIQGLGAALSAGVSAYQHRGIAHAIRASYECLGLTMDDFFRCVNDYDLLTKLIAYHEVGHAYTQHITYAASRPIEKRALELIADLLATQWFYQKMIVNTPDTEQYRALRDVTTHSEAIFTNALMCFQNQQGLLALMAIAGAQRNAGAVSLDGGQSHPPGLQRHSLQYLALRTLIESNFASLLSPEQVRRLDADWHERTEALIRCGLIGRADLEGILDPSECDTIELAAELIEQFGIRDLRAMTPWLKDTRRQITESLKNKLRHSKGATEP